jgi:peptidoglycan/xylan/chitin deacetylase (PgdA/CDA1 family)
MLKAIKQAALKSLKSIGAAKVVHNSRWRQSRLLILAYHGVSLADEHCFNGSLFVSADLLRSRFEILKRSKSTVLPLEEGIARLYANDLPERAVAVTFDDGLSDFHRRAFPIIREFNIPVTLYLTTFYSHYQRPVFDLMCAYLLWKGRDKVVNLKPLTGNDLQLDLARTNSRAGALQEIHGFARRAELSADEKDTFAASLAKHLDVDYDTLLANRVMHNLTADEVSDLSGGGINIELHTHRHRTPLDHNLFVREIEENRASILAMTGKSPNHFCYPSGKYDLRFLPWLQELGVISGVTCDIGFASSTSDRLLLSRFLDSSNLSPIEFESWLCGISAALPQRRAVRDDFSKPSPE